MDNESYRRYHRLAMALTLAVCAYPVYMGIVVVVRMLANGAVPIEDYPKYVIPYAPIALALIASVAVMPLLHRRFGKRALLFGSILAVAVFYLAETLMEEKFLVQGDVPVPFDNWQMFACYINPDLFETRTWTAINVLLGEYSPAFKLHFHLISLIIIVSLLNAVYGFGWMILSGDQKRRKALIIQTVCTAVFVGMCIWACFTAFYRNGSLMVSPLSAALMMVFFIVMGLCMGVYAASFMMGKGQFVSTGVPVIIAVATTSLMYVGELILLSGNLYRLGSGFLFEPLGALVLAPADLLTIAASGGLTWLICRWLNR